MVKLTSIICVGGGPAGLYAAILLKNQHPDATVDVFERHARGETFGFGVVFSDRTMANFAAADPQVHGQIIEHFAHWDDIVVHVHGQRLRSTGHGFCGLSRRTLLEILSQRCDELGVRLHFGHEVSSVEQLSADLIVVADGLNSRIRTELATRFEPHLDWRSNRFIWLGTSCPFPEFSFFFKETEHGLFRAHAYQYEAGNSTFIVECSPAALVSAGLENDDPVSAVAFCQELFTDALQGHELRANHSMWREFPTVTNRRWSCDNAVLIGDAAHTAHFSIGSGTKLAMEDVIALTDSLAGAHDVSSALQRYEHQRRGPVESVQRAAQASLEWFEDTERYSAMDPIQFGFSLLTRSLRITHENLGKRDPVYIQKIDRWYAQEAARQTGQALSFEPPPPPMFTPFKLRGLVLPNRIVVSPMCMYSAVDGMPNDWHLVHLGSRAVGGAGLVIAEMTDVSAEGRITEGCTGLYRDAHVDAWAKIVRFVHEHSFAKIGIQLGHAGRKGSTRRLWEGQSRPLDDGWPLLAPSPIPYAPGFSVPGVMDLATMLRVKNEFVRAAKRAVAAGFDLVELHCAHGYLLSSFISPLTNRRGDAYGGTLENRLRYPLEILRAIRDVLPTQMPLSVRISASEWADGGTTTQESVEIAKALKGNGCDIVDVSTGMTVRDAAPEYGRLYQTPFADRIRHEASIPTMAVGNISSYMDVNTILAAGRADLCVLARAHLFRPYWTHEAAALQNVAPSWPPQYAVLDGYKSRFE